MPGHLVSGAVLAVLAGLTAVAVIAQAELLARLVVEAVQPDDDGASTVQTLGLALVAVVTARALLGLGQQQVAARAALRVKSSLRLAGLRAAQQRPDVRRRQESTGELTTTLGRGLDAVDEYVTGYLPQLVLAAVVPFAVLFWLLLTDPAAAVVVLITLPLLPVFGILIGLRTRAATDRQWVATRRLGGQFLDLVQGLPTLRVLGRARAQAELVRSSAERHRSATMSTLRMAFLSALALELVATLSIALIAVPVGLRLLDGRLDLQTALVVLVLAPEAYLPIRQLGSRFHASAEGMAVAEQVFALLDEPLAPTASTPAPAAVDVVPEIVLQDVGVTYPGSSRPALADVNLCVRPGERVGVVGPSGAGKSTLIAVLLGLVRPTTGRVLLRWSTPHARQPGGPVTAASGAAAPGAPDPTATGAGWVELDLAAIDLADWRQRLTWVPQTAHVFAGTLGDQIRLGAPDASPERMTAAVTRSGLAPLLDSLPQGLDTVLGEDGHGLSSGQRQRVVLARAFLRDAGLLLLDEPTAGLDAATEADVVRATGDLLRGRTAVAVAHRPAVLDVLDRTVRLVDGRVVADDDLAGTSAIGSSSSNSTAGSGATEPWGAGR